MASLNDLVPGAQSVLHALRLHFISQTQVLAETCSQDGVIDSAKLDEFQVCNYELAWLGAELLASETSLKALSADISELKLRLALTFVAEMIESIAERLFRISLDLDWNFAPVRSLLDAVDAKSLSQALLAGKTLGETGRLLCESRDEIGYTDLGDDLLMAQDQFRRLAAERVVPVAMEVHRGDLIVPETVLQPLREMGAFGLSIPQRYGGTAPDEREDNLMMIVITEALAEASLGAAGSLITRPEILSRALLAGGTERQKHHWLPQIAAGRPLCAIAITEPNFGSDVASLQLRAERATGGWMLNGAKTWCTFAGKAGLLMVVARTSADRTLGHRGLSIMLIEKPIYEGHAFDFEQPGGGRLTGKAIATIGYRGMHSFDLSFDNLFVPDENLLGGEAGLGKGFYYTMAGMVGGRMQTAARASGVMRAALLAALNYAGNRKVFNAPLAHYPLTRAKLARMAARFVACRAMTYAVGKLLDVGLGRMESSLVKLFACRSAELITRESLQIHGGMGYAEESPISRYFVDARVLSIFEGAEETLALKVIARSLLEESLRSKFPQPSTTG